MEHETTTTEWTPDNPWEEHPEYIVRYWLTEVKNGDTRLGYIEWVNAQIQIEMDA